MTPADLLRDWSWDWAILLTIAVGSGLWLRGRAVLKRAPTNTVEWGDRWWYVPAFLSADAVMVLAACSPIDELSAKLFWVHMVQHLLLLMLVAPLLVAAAPWLPLWYGLPAALRGRADPALRSLAAAGDRVPRLWALLFLLLFIAGTWIWHLPRLYDLALSNDIIHDYGEHNTFLLVGLLFWLQVIPSPPFGPLLGMIGRGMFLVVAIIQNVALSMVLAFAGRPLYSPYVEIGHRPGGISALMDQQLGAAIMWSVGDLPFVIALIALLMTWLGAQISEDDETAAPAIASRPV
jgi:cytochrome c oxidase assembly factor CtaG